MRNSIDYKEIYRFHELVFGKLWLTFMLLFLALWTYISLIPLFSMWWRGALLWCAVQLPFVFKSITLTVADGELVVYRIHYGVDRFRVQEMKNLELIANPLWRRVLATFEWRKRPLTMRLVGRQAIRFNVRKGQHVVISSKRAEELLRVLQAGAGRRRGGLERED